MKDILQTQNKNIDIEIMRKDTIVFEPSRRTYLKDRVLTIRKKRDIKEKKKSMIKFLELRISLSFQIRWNSSRYSLG